LHGVITFEPFVLGLQCIHQNAQQKLLLTDRQKVCVWSINKSLV